MLLSLQNWHKLTDKICMNVSVKLIIVTQVYLNGEFK